MKLLAPKEALLPAAASAMPSPPAPVHSLRSSELDDARIAFARPTLVASTSRSPRSKRALPSGRAPKEALLPAAASAMSSPPASVPSHRSLRALLAIAVGALFALTAVPASAADGKSGHQTTWTVFQGDRKVGKETLRVVNKSGRIFASGTRKITRGSARGHRTTHVQRSGGKLAKYIRKEKVRLGTGVKAFEKGGMLRVVGINQRQEAREHSDVLNRRVWDPTVLHWLALWTGQLSGNESTIGYFDISSQTTGSATFKRRGTTKVADKDGKPVEVVRWSVSGVGDGIDELFVGSRGQLIGLKGDLQLLRKGWAWMDDDADEGDAKKTDAKKTDAKKTDAKKTDAKKGDAKKGDAKKTDAKKTDAKKTDAKKTDAKKTDSDD